MQICAELSSYVWEVTEADGDDLSSIVEALKVSSDLLCVDPLPSEHDPKLITSLVPTLECLVFLLHELEGSKKYLHLSFISTIMRTLLRIFSSQDWAEDPQPGRLEELRRAHCAAVMALNIRHTELAQGGNLEAIHSYAIQLIRLGPGKQFLIIVYEGGINARVCPVPLIL